jgi:hypothetical protein
MRNQIQDPLIAQVCARALDRQPALISCKLLITVEIVAQYLLSKGYVVRVLKADTFHSLGEIVRAFDAGEIHFVVATWGSISNGGFWFKRPGFAFATHPLTQMQARMLHGRFRNPPDNDHALEIEDECSPPL